MKRGLNKSGLSTIIVTLILIVISLAAIGVFWLVINNIIKSGSEQIGLDRFIVDAEIKNVGTDNVSNNISLTFKRKAGSGEMTGIKFVFTDGFNTEVATEEFSLKELEEKKFIFHLTKLLVDNLLTISIVPVIKTDDGDELVGSTLGTYNVKKGNYEAGTTTPSTCTPATCTGLGYNCGTHLNGTCAGSLSCGSCGTGYTCTNGVCVVEGATCTGTTCSALGYTCGTHQNGTCSTTLNCGTCGTGYTCVSGQCVLSTGGNIYYIDYEAGSDSNNGLSTSSPWKHCPGDDNAIGNPDSTTLQAGDTVIFKGGVEYIGEIKINHGGSSGNYITYDGNSNGLWGTGKAIINNSHSPVYITGFTDTAQRSYITIKSFKFTEIGGYTQEELFTMDSSNCDDPPRSGIGISLVSGSTNINIFNCDFFYLGFSDNHPANSNEYGSLTGVGISLVNNNNIIIDGCDFKKMKIGVSIKGNGATISNIEVRNSSWGDWMVWGMDIAPQLVGSTLQRIYIHDNHIFDHDDWTSNEWLGCGDNPHLDGIFLRTSGIQDSTWNDVRIYNNRFENSAQGTSDIYLSQGPSALIYNNEFINNSHGAGAIYIDYPLVSGTMPNPQKIDIYSNSFVGASLFVHAKGASSAQRDVNIVNNIFKDLRTGITSPVAIYLAFTDSANIDTLNYNQYYTDLSTRNIAYINGAYKSFVGLQTDGYELNGQFGDPVYINNTNLNLQFSSPARDHGLSMSQYFTTDKDGISRPQGSGWDIGAYEYH